MKTAEEVLREHTKGIYAFEHPTLPETLQDLRGAIIKAMELYASEQNAKLYPIKMLAWEITPETDPNALKSGSKFKAVCDGEVKIGGFGWGCGAASRLSEEKITRLTELLRKAMPRLYSWPYLQDEIENAIGHEKPN